MSARTMEHAEIVSCILEGRLIAVVRVGSPDEAVEVGRALACAGVHLIEITFTVPNAPQAIARLADESPDIIVGAGSVTDMTQVEAAIDAGARFVVSPIGFLEMIPICRRRGVVSMVAGLTPSELFRAWRAGSDFVKLFPAEAVGGPSYVRDILAPLPELPLVPTGGVTLDNFLAYLDAGARAVGLGSALVPKALTRARDWAALTEHAARFVEAMKDRSL
ncbi:MAG TPA: bifunctional 4-hydroxy-2-oxoglutarate aldolase/2-dehydro-3-deoxy-phosphogluconate aldolase [Caldilineae bacterium]|nr:bifunctional 4-hydroxy-2-oxoglutarate aldolase/2-dehydro-3-deoxy-phosphogluconate aldolase [Caldilineae bacterium]